MLQRTRKRETIRSSRAHTPGLHLSYTDSDALASQIEMNGAKYNYFSGSDYTSEHSSNNDDNDSTKSKTLTREPDAMPNQKLLAGSAYTNTANRDISPNPSQGGDSNLPPSSTQPPPSSFFTASQEFEPDQTAPFEEEFSRYMSSQGIAPRTAEYTRQRTRAIKNELNHHYSSQQLSCDLTWSQPETIEAQRLHIYQGMCRAVHLPAHPTTIECVRALKTVLVNIVDFIDKERTGQPVKVWTDFEAFKRYTLSDDKRIDREEAKADGGFLAVLLRKLVGRNAHAGLRRGKKKRHRAHNVAKRGAPITT